jgi:hypothetical protein
MLVFIESHIQSPAVAMREYDRNMQNIFRSKWGGMVYYRRVLCFNTCLSPHRAAPIRFRAAV